jgi:hypothetical protein
MFISSLIIDCFYQIGKEINLMNNNSEKRIAVDDKKSFL